MAHEPDWESLGTLQFLRHSRVTEQLNAALAAISMINADAPGTPSDYWQEQATQAVQRVLQTENAWAGLVRHKLGERLLPQQMRPFRAGDVIRWLALEIRAQHGASPSDDTLLLGNPESLQEALLLLHSCAGTLGPQVRLLVSHAEQGMWFRIRFNLVKSVPQTHAELVQALALASNWRAEIALFELRRAEDFLAMNGCALHYSLGDDYGELAFCVPTARAATHGEDALPTLVFDDDTARDFPAAADLHSTPVTPPSETPPKLKKRRN